MTDLLIDLGNSRLKWAQCADGCWLPGAAMHRGRDIIEVLDEIWGDLPAPERAVLASVATDEARSALEFWIQDRWACAPHGVQAQREQLGVLNGYRDPHALGADRWMALIAARALTDAACAVVSCGTAVTVDVLTREGLFAGGVILPGRFMQRQSLSAGTAAIGDVTGDDTTCLARATADGVAAGVLFGLAGAIERCVLEQERQLNDTLELFITGGDASVLAPRLTRMAVEVPDLVLQGLARVAEELAAS